MAIKDLIPWSREKRDVPVHHHQAESVLGLQLDINRVFDDFWRALQLPALGAWDAGLGSDGMPRIDVRETDKEVEVVADLPGMDEGDIDVTVTDGSLILRGERKAEREEADQGYVVRERIIGRFERVVPLPEQLDFDAAQATFRNGTLTIRIPRGPDAQAAVKHVSVKRS